MTKKKKDSTTTNKLLSVFQELSIVQKWVWSGIIGLGTIVGVFLSVKAATSSIAEWRDESYGRPPYADRGMVYALAERTVNQITSEQIGRQIEINRLENLCNANRCSPYDRGALQNLRNIWIQEQRYLDQLQRNMQKGR